MNSQEPDAAPVQPAASSPHTPTPVPHSFPLACLFPDDVIAARRRLTNLWYEEGGNPIVCFWLQALGEGRQQEAAHLWADFSTVLHAPSATVLFETFRLPRSTRLTEACSVTCTQRSMTGSLEEGEQTILHFLNKCF